MFGILEQSCLNTLSHFHILINFGIVLENGKVQHFKDEIWNNFLIHRQKILKFYTIARFV